MAHTIDTFRLECELRMVSNRLGDTPDDEDEQRTALADLYRRVTEHTELNALIYEKELSSEWDHRSLRDLYHSCDEVLKYLAQCVKKEQESPATYFSRVMRALFNGLLTALFAASGNVECQPS